jgi:hypothetical protein
MTRRSVPPGDVARYWESRHVGRPIRDSAKLAGVHYNTALNWEKKAKDARLEHQESSIGLAKASRSVGHKGTKDISAQMLAAAEELNGPVPYELLNERAKRGLDDFDYFRSVYLGRAPSPWQVEAAYQIKGFLESEDREYLVLNVPPGAGKSTLFHDVAVWMICRRRDIRILIGSVSGKLATQYSRRVRDTLERTVPMEPSEHDVVRGLAVQPESCLAWDYGRFRPLHQGSLWRADEFIVEQYGAATLNNKEPTVSSYGMDAEFIGHRADLCLYDDVANPENSKEGAARDRLLEKWDAVAEARCEPGGLLAVIGQRLAPTDLYAHCLNKKAFSEEDDEFIEEQAGVEVSQIASVKELRKYHHITYKSYFEELDTSPDLRKKGAPAYPDGPLLDPQRIPWKDIQYLRASNRTKFEIVYQQQADAEQGSLVLKVHAMGGLGPDGILYPGCIDRDRDPGHIPPHLAEPLISIATIDPSPTQFWGCQWWILQPDTNLRYLVDLERPRLSAEELLGYDTTTGNHFGLMEEWQNRSQQMGKPITHWVVEINAAQRFLLAHDFVRKWQAKHAVQIVPHTTNRNKWDADRGIESLLPPLWRSGAIRLPSMRHSWKTLAFIQEMSSWRPDKKKGTDLVMAHWFAEMHWPTVGAIKTPPRMWRPSWMRDTG